MPTRGSRRRGRGLAPPHAAARREAREQLAQRDRLLQQWLTGQLAGDRATAHLVWWVGTLHAGLIAWTAEARDAHVLPVPSGTSSGTGSVSGTADQDRAMLRALAPNVEALDLEHVRGRVVGKLADLHGWYSDQLRAAGITAPWPDARVIRWAAAWTGDISVGAELGRCLELHAALKRRGDTGRRKAAEARWRRLAAWYVRLLDGRTTQCDLT